MAAIWAYDPPLTVWRTKSLVVRTFGPALESSGALTVGSEIFENGAYEVYGKGLFLVYLAMVPIVRHVHRRYRSGGGETRWELWPWRLMYGSLLVAVAADFASYWGISLPGPVGDALWGAGFGIELLASALLLVSTTVYGVVSMRLRVVPMWASLLLIGVIPMAILVLANLAAYAPNGYAVPLSIVWALIGGWALFQPEEVMATAEAAQFFPSREYESDTPHPRARRRRHPGLVTERGHHCGCHPDRRRCRKLSARRRNRSDRGPAHRPRRDRRLHACLVSGWKPYRVRDQERSGRIRRDPHHDR